MTAQKITKIVQIVCVAIAILIFLMVHGNAKYLILAVLGLGLLAHFYEFIHATLWSDIEKAKSSAQAELGKIDQSVIKEVNKL